MDRKNGRELMSAYLFCFACGFFIGLFIAMLMQSSKCGNCIEAELNDKERAGKPA